MVPRIRGKVGEALEGPHLGKWYFELSVWDLGGEKQHGETMQVGPFDTEEIAHQEMKQTIQVVCEDFEQKAVGEKSGRYLDMKAGGVMRPWKDHS